MSKKQTIPRHFHKLTGKMKVGTSMNKPEDVLHIFKNDDGPGYISVNTRTGEMGYMFYSYIHNPDIFELISIER